MRKRKWFICPGFNPYFVYSGTCWDLGTEWPCSLSVLRQATLIHCGKGSAAGKQGYAYGNRQEGRLTHLRWVTQAKLKVTYRVKSARHSNSVSDPAAPRWPHRRGNTGMCSTRPEGGGEAGSSRTMWSLQDLPDASSQSCWSEGAVWVQEDRWHQIYLTFLLDRVTALSEERKVAFRGQGRQTLCVGWCQVSSYSEI